MTRIRRRRRAVERLPLDEMPWPELLRLLQQGRVTSAEVAAATRERAVRDNGGVGPYDHLKWEGG